MHRKTMKKKLLSSMLVLALAAMMLLGAVPAVYAADIGINIDGAPRIFLNADGSRITPIEKDGTTYLPVRDISNVVGEQISWEGAANTVYIGTRSVQAPYSSQPFTSMTALALRCIMAM